MVSAKLALAQDMTDYVFLTLLILHVGSIVGWMGAAIFFVSVLGPSIKTMSPEAQDSFSLNMIPRYSRYVLVTSILSLIFGIMLYGYSEMPGSGVAVSSSGLVWIQAGAGLGVVAFILVLAIVWPSSKKIVKIVKETRSGGSAGALASVQSRARMGAGIVSALLVIVLILMITGAVI